MGQPERLGQILQRVLAEMEEKRRYERKGRQLNLPFGPISEPVPKSTEGREGRSCPLKRRKPTGA